MIKQERPGKKRLILNTDQKAANLSTSELRQLPLTESEGDSNHDLSLERIACSIYATRRERRRFLPASLFGEAGWDMLLLLYWADAHGRGLNASILTKAVGAPESAALRWLQALENEGLIVQHHNSTGPMSHIVALTDSARASLARYLRQFASTRL